MNIGDALLTEAQGLQQRWQNWMNDPGNRALLLQTGVNLMQPMSVGQSTLGHIGQAVGAGGEARARYEEQERANEQLDYNRRQAEEDRRFKRLDADRRNRIDERQVSVSERNAASMEDYRKRNGGLSLNALFANSNRDQDRFENWIAKQAQVAAENDLLTGDPNNPRTVQSYLDDPAWVQGMTQAWQSIPKIAAPSGTPTTPPPSAGTVPPPAMTPQVPGQTSMTPTPAPQAQPIPSPSAPTPQWKVGQRVTTPQGTFVAEIINGQPTWRKIQ